MTNHSIIEESRKTFYMRELNIQEITGMNCVPIDVYFFHQGHFEKLLHKNDELTKSQWVLLVKNLNKKFIKLFCEEESRHYLDDYYQQKLREFSRGLSIDISQEKIQKHTHLLMHNLQQLYHNPNDNDLLQILYQSIKGLAAFYYNNSSYIPYTYHICEKSNLHYKLKQPLLSSLILVGLLIYSKQFNLREIENMFVLSCLKDIGMSFWPKHLLDKKILNEQEIELIKHHPMESQKILLGRIPLSSNYFKILTNHHESSHQLLGIETHLVRLCDILVAMIHKRPYREEITLFSGLNIVKDNLPSQYNQEYKIFVLYLQNFFKIIASYSSR